MTTKITSGTASKDRKIANINPFRYRGYYYDDELGFYYLNSRYYDPKIGRFINADSVMAGTTGDVQGYNLFAYCFNNPLGFVDSNGSWPQRATTHLINTGDWKEANEIALSVTASISLAETIRDAIVGRITKKFIHISGEISPEQGFETYRQLKNEIGSAGAGYEWHHIVEQCQIARSGFSPQMVQNINNVMPISVEKHRLISAFYSSRQDVSDGMIVRDWLAGQSFSVQFEFGLKVVDYFK